MREPVGLVGVGLLGRELAVRLAAAGFPVVAHDLAADKLADLPVEPATGLAEVARRCRRIVLCLPHSGTVQAVVDGPTGLCSIAAPAVVDTTTGDPAVTRALAAELAQRGGCWIDATVMGSSQQVRRGEAVLLLGGTPAAIAAQQDLLGALAPRSFVMGPPGAGATAKLVLNLVLGLHRLVLAEGLDLGERAGLDPGQLLEALRSTVAASRVMDTKGARMLYGDYAPEARLAQHAKDVGLICELAARVGAAVPLSHLHDELLQAALATGLGELDNSAVRAWYRQTAGHLESPPAAGSRETRHRPRRPA
ncbi:MAG: NAD(P)-dependent oxidoreductase [Fimbriimonadaceae bacterium]|nr:NAD(P)-dependent oxidoreductase [Fimbriimonadaceae bacterium]